MIEELKEGEEACPVCKGKGYTCDKDDKYDNTRTCWKCWGHGKLDWIELVVGKRDGSFVHYDFFKNVNLKLTKEGWIEFEENKK